MHICCEFKIVKEMIEDCVMAAVAYIPLDLGSGSNYCVMLLFEAPVLAQWEAA